MRIKAKSKVAHYATDNHQHFDPIECTLRQAVIKITTKYKDTLSPYWAAQIRITDGDEVTDEEGDVFFEVAYSGGERLGEDALEEVAGKLCAISELNIETSGFNRAYPTYSLCENILGTPNFDPETIDNELIHEILQTEYCSDMTEDLHRKILKEHLYYFRDGGIKIRCDVTTNVDSVIDTTATPNVSEYHQASRRFILIAFRGALVQQLDTFFALKIFKELQRILGEYELSNTFYYHIEQLETSNYLAKFFISELGITETPA